MTEEHNATKTTVTAMSVEISRIRTAAGISQRAFADSVGVSSASVRNWETGVCLPSAQMARAIDTNYADHEPHVLNILNSMKPESIQRPSRGAPIGPRRKHNNIPAAAPTQPDTHPSENPDPNDIPDGVKLADYDDVNTFAHIIRLLKLYMLLNPEGRRRAIDAICETARDPQYQCIKMRELNQNQNKPETADT